MRHAYVKSVVASVTGTPIENVRKREPLFFSVAFNVQVLMRHRKLVSGADVPRLRHDVVQHTRPSAGFTIITATSGFKFSVHKEDAVSTDLRFRLWMWDQRLPTTNVPLLFATPVTVFIRTGNIPVTRLHNKYACIHMSRTADRHQLCKREHRVR
jgi:hypothetical protein